MYIINYCASSQYGGIIPYMELRRVQTCSIAFQNLQSIQGEGRGEGGCGGNSAMPERIELSPRHLPEYLEGRTSKKNVLSFLAEIGRAQIRKARNIFLWCRRVKRGGGGAASFGGG